jgi:hypothetical protein
MDATVLNENDFCRDMMDGDWKIWGNTPWDPQAWELSKKFVEKWWFLLDEDVLKSTNFWRAQRLEEPLVLPSDQNNSSVWPAIAES